MDYLAQNTEKIGMAPAVKAQLKSHQIESPVTVRMKKGGGLEMIYRNCFLYDKEKPIENAVADIQRLQGESEQDLVVFFGLGFGIHAEFLKKRFNAPLLIFEPSLDILKTTLSLRPFQFDNVFLETNFGRLAEIIDQRMELSDRRMIVAIHRQYRELFSKEIDRFTFVVQQAANSV
ncbi:MAG: hypothetical protein JXX14_06030, partial [Deltaproteobacteria bacterium]|nr:hypothetical protein [Deltaproteobacteria bacterium]